MKSVYAITRQNGSVKIGISTAPNERLKTLAVSSPDPLAVYYSTAPRADALLVERAAQFLLRGKRLKGEWFDVTAEEARRAIVAAIKMVETGAFDIPHRHFVMKLGVEEARMLDWLAARYNRSKGSIVRDMIRKRYATEQRSALAEASIRFDGDDR